MKIYVHPRKINEVTALSPNVICCDDNLYPIFKTVNSYNYKDAKFDDAEKKVSLFFCRKIPNYAAGENSECYMFKSIPYDNITRYQTARGDNHPFSNLTILVTSKFNYEEIRRCYPNLQNLIIGIA